MQVDLGPLTIHQGLKRAKLSQEILTLAHCYGSTPMVYSSEFAHSIIPLKEGALHFPHHGGILAREPS